HRHDDERLPAWDRSGAPPPGSDRPLRNQPKERMKPNRTFEASRALSPRLHAAIPGGAHTYAKGDDQYPEDTAPVIVRGRGCRVWEADGNDYIEYGSGWLSVSLGLV